MSNDAASGKGESSAASEPTVDGFEATLKEIVNGKRLSASKMSSLTEMSLKLMEHDTQLVSVLYRTHKALPTKAKIPSLYVFDSLCRAARSQVNKYGLTGVINAEKGNAATFLMKIEGVLDGLFQDVASSGLPEAKEKTRKVLDIWTKANTFPPDVLTRLADQGNVVEKENKQASSSTTTTTADPRRKPTPPTVNTVTPLAPPPSASPVTATPTHDSAQAALLALLTSATAAAAKSQTAVNTPNVSGVPPINTGAHSQPRIDPAKLLLQQLTNNVNNVGIPQVAPFAASPTITRDPNFPGPILHSPTNATTYPGSDRREQGYNGYNGPLNRAQERPPFHDNRRGGFRGEHNRGGHYAQQSYTRDDFRSGRYEERDRHRNGDDRGPYSGQRFSRSRSPPSRKKFEAPSGRRDVRPYSPPGRPSLASMGQEQRSKEPIKRASPPKASGKDEFGRDIRSPSVEVTSAPAQRAPSETRLSTEERSTRSRDMTPQLQQNQGQLSPESEGKSGSATTSMTGGLDSFDFSAFTPTDPMSWKMLGDAFKVTNGYLPSQEELMQYILGQMMSMGMGMGTMGFAGMPAQGPAGYDQGNPQVYGSASESSWNESPSNTDSWNAASMKNQPEMPKISDNNPMAAESGSPGGQMRKMGDRWIFVKDGAQS